MILCSACVPKKCSKAGGTFSRRTCGCVCKKGFWGDLCDCKSAQLLAPVRANLLWPIVIFRNEISLSWRIGTLQHSVVPFVYTDFSRLRHIRLETVYFKYYRRSCIYSLTSVCGNDEIKTVYSLRTVSTKLSVFV